jgi:hypothetical protein
MANLTNINGYFNVTNSGLVNVVNGGLYVTKTSGDSIVGISSSGGSGKPYYLKSNTSGSFLIYDDTACDARLTISSGGDATFSGIVTTDKTFVAKGQNVSHGTSQIKISQENTTKSQIRFYGADTSTAGILEFTGSSSDGSVGGARVTINADGTTKFHANILVDVINNSANSANIIYRSGTSTLVGGGTTANKLYVLDNGNVGIGTDSPDGKLEVAGGTTLGLRITNAGDSSAYDQTRITYSGYNSGSPEMVFMPLTTPGSGVLNTFFRFRNTNGSSTTSNNVANVSIDGELGIGTDSPVQPLHVNGQVLFRTTTADGGKNRFQLVPGGSSDAANLYLYYGNSGDGTLSVRINAQGDSYFNGGNVGIGVTSPDAKLDVQSSGSWGQYGRGSSGDINVENTNTSVTEGGWISIAGYMGNTANSGFYHMAGITAKKSTTAGDGNYGGDLSFWTTSGGANGEANSGMYQRMTIDSSGDVGIGTTSPSEKLQIVGNTYISGVGNQLLFDTTGALGSNKIKTINDYETVIATDRGSAGFAVIGNSNIRLGFGTNYTNAETDLYINTSGNVGIGNTSPSAKLTIDNSISTSYSTTGYAATPANSMLYLNNTNGGSNTASLINFRTGSGDGVLGFVEGGGTNDADFVIQTDGGSNGIERFRITNAGNVGIGTTSPVCGLDVRIISGAQFYNESATESNSNIRCRHEGAETTSDRATQISFRDDDDNEVGSIKSSGSSTFYNTSSDYRLKQNEKDFNGLDLVDNIKVYDFEWKKDGGKDYGVFAHELQEIVPEAVSGEKDGEEMQGVDYSRLVPILLKSIQELKAEIEELKSNKCNCNK